MPDRLGSLRALGDDLRRWLDEAPVDKRAPLAAQYRAVLVEIAELTRDSAPEDGVDEIAKRRAARRERAAKGAARTRKGS